MSCLLNTSSTHLVSLSTAIIFCALATYGIVFRNGHFVNTVEPVYDGRFPRIKRKWYQSLMLSNPVAGLVTRGYRSISKITQKPFQVTYWGKPYLFLPPKQEYLVDIRRAARDHLSFIDNMSDLFFLYNWVEDLFTSERMVFVIIKGLNPHLQSLTDAVIDIADHAFEAELGDCTNGKSIVAFPVIMNLSLREASRVIIGNVFCRNEQFLDALQTYFNWNFMTGVLALKLPLGPFRNILGWPLWKLQQHRLRKVIDALSPYVQKRMHDDKLGIGVPSEIDGMGEMLKMMKLYPVEDISTPELEGISQEMIQLLWAAGHSPGSTLTQMVFSILEHTSYIEPLHKEAEAAIAEHGWTERAFAMLPLQDSYIREVNQLYPTFSLNATRTVIKKPFTFSDGLTLPVGTRIALPAQAIQRDSDFIKDPLEFDGFRFVRLAKEDARQEDGVNKWAASHSGKMNLSFGYGNHACPGRFLTVRMLKVVFTKLILEYDVGWDRSEPGQPAKFSMEGISAPNVIHEVYIKKRSV